MKKQSFYKDPKNGEEETTEVADPPADAAPEATEELGGESGE